MPDLPVMLNVRGKLAVVVGGGVAARRRIASLIECGARTRVIAPHVDQAIETAGGEVHRRAYREGDLEGACLVVIATDDPQVNDAVQREAIRRGALVNRAMTHRRATSPSWPTGATAR
jgi:precorrin-2 dehydrogenase / sirohydrochlorin ferrochelatase